MANMLDLYMSLNNARVAVPERTRGRKKDALRKFTATILRSRGQAGAARRAAVSGTRALEYGPVGSRVSSFGLMLSPPRASRRAHTILALTLYAPPRPVQSLSSLFVRLIVAWHSLPSSCLIRRHVSLSLSPPSSTRQHTSLFLFHLRNSSSTYVRFFRTCGDRANFRPMHGHASVDPRDHNR